jgi:hypothetical protein
MNTNYPELIGKTFYNREAAEYFAEVETNFGTSIIDESFGALNPDDLFTGSLRYSKTDEVQCIIHIEKGKVSGQPAIEDLDSNGGIEAWYNGIPLKREEYVVVASRW